MPTVLADSFTAALARLNNDEQKQAKLTAFDLQTEPDRPGLQFHRIDKSKDPHFWSVRVNRDLRIVVHKRGASLMLVYVGHHDDAYQWAARRRIEQHPRTGALQIVELRERVEDLPLAAAIDGVAEDSPFLERQEVANLPFVSLDADGLMSLGVPEDWIGDVQAATEDSFLDLAAHLPQEAAEALLEYAATGRLPEPSVHVADAFSHPDTLRRFRVLEGHEELQAALDWPFEKWAVFLHPAQRDLVSRDYSGPVRVAGSAGTGKTVVALHRVMHFVQSDPDAKVLLTTFSDPLAQALERKLAILSGGDKALAGRVTVASWRRIATELYALVKGRKPFVADSERIRQLVPAAAKGAGVTGFSTQFMVSEWENVVDARRISTLEEYAAAPRIGRLNRIGARQREQLWTVFDRLRKGLEARGILSPAAMFQAVVDHYAEREDKPFSHIVVDEAQDLGPAELRFVAAIAPSHGNALFFAGDIGQRIFRQPYSWKALGIDVRGRSFSLRVNYRTSQQIRRMADLLLPPVLRDVDGLEDDRRGTVSVFHGVEPQVVIADDATSEQQAALAFIRQALDEGVQPDEIGIFCRSTEQLGRARAIAEAAGLPVRTRLDEASGTEGALVGLMHLAKGLEFRVVLVVACDEGVLPLASRIEGVADEFELDEVVATERQLLYVACTRARERLFVSGVAPGSEYLEEISQNPQ